MRRYTKKKNPIEDQNHSFIQAENDVLDNPIHPLRNQERCNAKENEARRYYSLLVTLTIIIMDEVRGGHT